MKPRRLLRPALLAILMVSTGGCALESRTVTSGGGVVVAPDPVVGGGDAQPAPGGVGPDPANPATPSIEVPVPGQQKPVPVNVWKIEPAVNGRHVTVLLSWWSGVAPCSVLDSVEVIRDGTTISLTPREGSDPKAAGGQVACPAIAMLRGTIVDLGDLEPGTWTLAPKGDLAPVAITIE